MDGPIGVCGTGRMGTAVALRLLSLGEKVVVWNRTVARAQPLAAEGARIADSPAALTAACGTVISLLFDGAAVTDVYGGADGLLAGPASGRLFVEMSTIGPVVAQAVADRVLAAGGAFVECPVGGSVAPARDGTLLGLAGGRDADVARARPVLEKLCRRIEHAGPVGAGARLKLAVNLPLMVYWAALGEALSLVAGDPMEPERLVGLMADTSGACRAMVQRSAAVAALVAGHPATPAGFSAAGGLKDVGEMLAEASRAGLSLPVASAAHEAYAAALAAGEGESDPMVLAALGYRSRWPSA